MWTRVAPLGALLLTVSALHAEPREAVASEHWYATLASAPIDVDELRDGLRRLVGLESNGLILNETRLPEAVEIDEFDLSESSREWLAATRAPARRPVDRYALLWDEEPAGSAFESSNRTTRRSIDDDESVRLFGENENSLENLVSSDLLSTTNSIRGLVLAD